MAYELQHLREKRYARRSLYHDLKSFVWVLLWIVTMFHGPGQRDRPDSDEEHIKEFRRKWEADPTFFKTSFMTSPEDTLEEPGLVAPYFHHVVPLLLDMQALFHAQPHWDKTMEKDPSKLPDTTDPEVLRRDMQLYLDIRALLETGKPLAEQNEVEALRLAKDHLEKVMQPAPEPEPEKKKKKKKITLDDI